MQENDLSILNGRNQINSGSKQSTNFHNYVSNTTQPNNNMYQSYLSDKQS
jgi:hypothetical protein